MRMSNPILPGEGGPVHAMLNDVLRERGLPVISLDDIPTATPEEMLHAIRERYGIEVLDETMRRVAEHLGCRVTPTSGLSRCLRSILDGLD